MTPKKQFNDLNVTNRFLFCDKTSLPALRLRQVNGHANARQHFGGSIRL